MGEGYNVLRGVYHLFYPRSSGITAGNAGTGLGAGEFLVFLSHKLSIKGFGNSNIGALSKPKPLDTYILILTHLKIKSILKN